MVNSTCNVHVGVASDFFILNEVCTSKQWHSLMSPATCILYIVEAVVAGFIALLTTFKYNSLNVLNFQIHINATSNTWWMVYFGLACARSIIQSIRYASRNIDKGVILLEILLHAFEVCSLGLMLNHQKRHRSSDQISYEIDNYSRSTRNVQQGLRTDSIYYLLGSANAALIVVFSAVIVSIILLEVIHSSPSSWFWLYISFAMTLHLLILILCLRIVLSKSEDDGPSAVMKLLLLMGTILMTPVEIPVFIWSHCVGIHCISGVMLTPFDFLLMLKIASLGFFFLALKTEFRRLSQQCHWAALNEVQRLGI